MKNYFKNITTPWTISFIVACLVGYTFSHLFWRILKSELEAFVRFFGEFIGFRPTFHVTITPGDASALKYGFWLIFATLFSNYLLRWALESIEATREFAKKMHKWVSKPLLFCLILGVLAPYALDLLVGVVRWVVYFCTGKMAQSWRIVIPFFEHKYHFTFDGLWEGFWLWLDGPLSPTTQHFGDELRRQL